MEMFYAARFIVVSNRQYVSLALLFSLLFVVWGIATDFVFELRSKIAVGRGGTTFGSSLTETMFIFQSKTYRPTA